MYGGLLVILGLVFGAYCYWRLDHFLSLYLATTFSRRAERIASTLLANTERNGETYLRNEIEARYAPESNDRFIRVTSGDGTLLYLSGKPNDQSFDPKEVAPPPAKTLSGISSRIEHVGGDELLISAMPFVSGQRKYLIEVGESALPIKDVQIGRAHV